MLSDEEFLQMLIEAVDSERSNINAYRLGVLKGVADVRLDFIDGLDVRHVFDCSARLYMSGKIGEWELEYILVCLELDDRFESDFTDNESEAIFNLSSPDLGYGISENNVMLAASIFAGSLLRNDQVWQDCLNRNRYRILV